MLNVLNEAGKFDHSNIMKNAHAEVASWRQDNPWMTYKQAFANALRMQYVVARSFAANYNGGFHNVLTLGD